MASISTPSAAGIPKLEYTKCFLKNKSESVDLFLKDTRIWEGDQSTDHFPKEIPKNEERQFTHHAKLGEGSAGGLQYAIGEGNEDKWIFAWNNPKKGINKLEYNTVFTQILIKDEDVDWDEIKKALYKSGQHCELWKLEFSSDVEAKYPPLDPKPTVKATFDHVLLRPDDKPESKG